ncbi:MAG: SCO family protein [Wenzhouxiangellaceae bacterium]
MEARFTTQDHRDVRFSDLVENRRVALQFIFTSCGTICPPMGAQFAALGKLLDEKGIDDVHLISVSIDPARDTPEKLAAWANRFGHDSGRWTLITAPAPSTDALLRALGMATGDKSDHPAVVLLNNGQDREWRPVNALSHPAVIVDALARLEPPALALEDRQ